MNYFLKLFVVLTACWLSTAHGHYYSNSNPFLPPRYGFQAPLAHGNTIKHQIQAFLPVSPTFEIEIMKPMAQLEEQKSVTLFIIPQNALHVFPHIQRIPARFPTRLSNPYPELTQLMGDPSHLPAIEIPLQSPMVVGTVESKVLAPAGFTVLIKGPFGASLPFPIHTGALLAPVPPGTIISAETPVVLNTIYAVPSLPLLPSHYPLFVDLPAKAVGPTKGTIITAVTPSTQKFTPSLISTSPVNLDISTPVDQSSSGEYFTTTVPTPPAFFQQDIPIENELPGREPNVIEIPSSGIVSGSGTTSDLDHRPFSNSKESPYLQELREQSILTLEAQISDLQRRLQQIRSN